MRPHVSAACPHGADVAVLFNDERGRVWAVVADDGCIVWVADPRGVDVHLVVNVLQQAARYAPAPVVH